MEATMLVIPVAGRVWEKAQTLRIAKIKEAKRIY